MKALTKLIIGAFLIMSSTAVLSQTPTNPSGPNNNPNKPNPTNPNDNNKPGQPGVMPDNPNPTNPGNTNPGSNKPKPDSSLTPRHNYNDKNNKGTKRDSLR